MNRGQGPRATHGKPFITRGSSSSSGGGTPDDNSVTSAKIVDGAIVNADINASAAIALSKLATDPLARANHTGTQTMSTISDAGTLATKSAVASADITDGTIVNADVNAAAAIASTKVVQAIGGDRINVNPGLYNEIASGTGSNFGGITALKPIFWPINVPVTAFSLSNIGMRISVLLNASTIGIGIFTVTYPSAAHVSATLVAQLNAAQSGSATGRFIPVLTTGAAGSGAGTLAMDFTANRYLIGAMVSDVSTLKLIGVSSATTDTGVGIISWTGAARSSVTDWPASFTEAANVAAVTAATPFPILDLVNATGAFFL